MISHPRQPRAADRGFSLVEVTLALGIAVFCLVVVFGLLNVGLNTSSASVEQTVATNVVAAVAGDLRTANNAVPKGSAPATTSVYTLQIPAAAAASPSPAPQPTPSTTPLVRYLDTTGQPVASAAGAHYQLSVWMKPGLGRSPTLARLLVTWPPGAAVPAGSVETLVALDRN